MGRKKFSELDCSYDVIIAGSGLAGLTAANVLGSDGFKVLLVEQHSQLGGLATYFRRKQHIFDVALHGFPIGMKKTFRKYWSKEMASCIVQVKNIVFDNPQFNITTTFTEEDFTNILVEKFGQERDNVRDFYKELNEMNFYDENNMKNRDLFEKYFAGRNDIVRLLMEPITYANGSDLDEPAITYGIVFSNFMSKGVYTYKGGTDIMLSMMEQELTKNNVDLCVNTNLERVIICDKTKKICGAILNGKEFKCRSVLSNGNLLTTINEIAGREHFSSEFLKKVDAVKINNSSCQVYIGIKKGEKFDYIGDLLFTSVCPEFSPERILDKNVTSRTFSIYYPEIRPHHPDYTIVASMNAKYEDWINLSESEYISEKRKLIEETIEALKRYIPNIEKKIDYTEAATPRTFERYTRHIGGASFGTKFEGLEVSMKLHEQISGLFHAGSVGIIMSGWLGAANYGVITANEIEKYLSKI